MTTNPPDAPISSKQAFAIAFFQATRLGLLREDAQDCAMDFVARLLGSGNTLPACSTAWLNRCARNHASNYARNVGRRQQKEKSWTERYGEDGDRLAQAHASATPGPKTLTMRKEFWRQVAAALTHLTPAQRDLFVRYHLRNESLQNLSLRYHRTPHALEESLSNIRKRLAVLLSSQGWTDKETQALFRHTVLARAASVPGAL